MAKNNQNNVMPPPPPPASDQQQQQQQQVFAPVDPQGNNVPIMQAQVVQGADGSQGPANQASRILGAEGQRLHHGQRICQEGGQDDVSQWLV
jgi:hypothetical protein